MIDDSFKPKYDFDYSMCRPYWYTSREGGDWKKWPDHNWHGVDFPLLSQRSKHTVIINNIEVHSLAFDNPSFGSFLRWDCRNGFDNHK